MRKSNSKCEICGKEKYRRPKEIKKAKHLCCRECRSELYKKYPEIVKNLDKGHGWNKGMSKAKGDILIYGKPRNIKTKQTISEALKGKLRVERIRKQCLNCKKYFYILPSQNWRNPKFCSIKCLTSYEPYRKKHSKYMSKRNATQKKTDTNIELILKNWFIENKISFEQNKLIEGICVDFFINPNIVLFADGDYWHNLPKTKERDKRQNRLLKGNGWRVIRLWGSKIENGARPKI